MSRQYLVAGNWKMFGNMASNQVLVEGMCAGLDAVPKVQVLVCPPATYLTAIQQAARGSGLLLGAQNLAAQEKEGAFTGEILGSMLKDVGCSHVIVGHSERRALFGDTDAVVAQKVHAALAAGLVPILCVGETLAEREADATEAVIARQIDAVLAVNPVASLAALVIAYEPVWAIGTGKTASPEQAQNVHAFIRARIAAVDAKLGDSLRILYGGSVKPDNAASIFAQTDVDGGLIGGASLKAADFLAICAAAQSQG
ncbi:MAG: triose-phosphate isomerase [Stagnimonas sp.]|nr:triose-phosphate isomerase [Stagnimonas sp.]